MKRSALIFVLLTLGAGWAFGGTVSLLTSRAGLSDGLDWSVLGASGASVPSGTTATSTGGNVVTVNFNDSQTGQIKREGSGWNGNFAPGDYLLWSFQYGPDTLTFGTPVSAVVFQVQADFYGDFTTQITAYDGATLLGSFSVNGVSNGSNDGSAVFLGIQDTSAEITSILIDGTAATSVPEDFAINGLSLSGGVATPEPGSFLLIGMGLAAALARRWRGAQGYRGSRPAE